MEPVKRMKMENAVVGFQYCFNQEGQLRHRETQEAFVFNYHRGEYKRNHQRYQALGQVITEHVYRLLEGECHLQRVYIPLDAKENEPKSLFFMSPGALDNPKGLVVLIQDQGVIRAGQWSRKLIVHSGLEQGSQIPFIKKALGDSCGVIVMNPNDNFLEIKVEEEYCTDLQNTSTNSPSPADPEDKEFFRIPKRCSSTPEEHVRYIWDHFVSKCVARHVAVIAHGYGGLVFVDLLLHRRQEVQSKVYAVAFIDSLHNMWHQVLDKKTQEWIQRHCRKWVLSSRPIDRPVTFVKVDCPQVSAGTQSHESAPWICLQSVFRFFTRALKVKNKVPFSRAVIVTRSKSKQGLAKTAFGGFSPF
ncbi:putative protein FAM172B [Polyodon spathula]|uniref:putative protein FAM172B n=1 Tax=Polyodon spathula TaxID=7913 RepID=UPI001B7F41E2|nr:putative protein FAM172B [Polyodon spathula]